MESVKTRTTPAGILGLLRLGNCVMGAFGALLAAVVCGGIEGVQDFALQVSLSMAIVVFFTGAGNSLNDYFDREIDKIAHPKRPIPAGIVRPNDAFMLSIAFFGVAFALSVFVNPWSLIIVLISIGVMLGYELMLKAEGFAGNLAISWLTGGLFLFGGAAVEEIELAWILALLAFLATLGREVVKDIQDLEGDKGVRKTLPMRIGARKASALGSGAFLAAVAVSPVPYLLELLSVWYVPVVAVADGVFIYCAWTHFRSPEKGQKTAKMAMLIALIAFLVGGVF